MSSPWVIYNFIQMKFDSYFAGWSQQNIVLSPPIWEYLISFSFLIPFVILGGKYIWKDKSDKAWLLMVWVLLFPIMAYFPIGVQRRLPEGILGG